MYSKTITKEMASSIDANIDDYKKKILSKQATIHEEIDEETISDKQSCSRLKSSKEASKKDVYDQFLDGLAE